jgi:hypothetical protein
VLPKITFFLNVKSFFKDFNETKQCKPPKLIKK